MIVAVDEKRIIYRLGYNVYADAVNFERNGFLNSIP